MFEPSIHHFNLSEVNDAAFVQRYCRQHKIYFMVYVIKWRNEVLKYGIQHSVAGNQPGERLYTQIGWMPGWKNGTLKRSQKTGDAVQRLIDYVNQKHKTSFHKDDVSVEVMDYTNFPFFDTKNRYAEMQNFEEHHKKLFNEKEGYYPIGNPKQEKIRFIPTQFDNLFEFD